MRPLLRLICFWKIDNKLNVKVDKHGHPMVGDTVMCYAAKQKDKYDRRKAKVERLNAHQAVITMLQGLAQGEKRKVDYKWLQHCSTSKKIFVSDVPSCEPVENPLRRRAPWRLTQCAEF